MKINNSNNNNNNNKMFNHKGQWYWISVSGTLIKSNIHIGNHKNEIKCLQLEFHFKNILKYFHFMFIRSIVFNFFFMALILMVTNTWVSFIHNRKVAVSIPVGVTGIFHWHNPSDRTMALGSTQPLTEMSTRRISCG